MATNTNLYLSNLAVWLVKLHNLHWNVTGTAFYSVHEYTEQLYNQVMEQYDEVAELMKMNGQQPAARLSDYLKLAVIKELDSRDFSVTEALGIIEGDMMYMQNLAKEIRAEAAQADCFQTQALFEGFAAGFAKQLWMLRATRSEGGCCCQG
ncbi:MAG: DNA starvation/stationary phase protection protein [Duodenibacillus sp.]|nr:DNA starvation/stationary phase protection protein [Duodenibacillus sp.]